MKTQGPIWLGLTMRVHSIRPYPDFADVRQMVVRSAYAQLRYSPLLLLGTTLGMALKAFLAGPLLGLFCWRPVTAQLLDGDVAADGAVVPADIEVLQVIAAGALRCRPSHFSTCSPRSNRRSREVHSATAAPGRVAPKQTCPRDD